MIKFDAKPDHATELRNIVVGEAVKLLSGKIGIIYEKDDDNVWVLVVSEGSLALPRKYGNYRKATRTDLTIKETPLPGHSKGEILKFDDPEVGDPVQEITPEGPILEDGQLKWKVPTAKVCGWDYIDDKEEDEIE